MVQKLRDLILPEFYKKNDTLRAWICIPLTMGIYERSRGTIDALFSPRLWTTDGLASLAGDKTFWDRSTLYALRAYWLPGKPGKPYSFYIITPTAAYSAIMYPIRWKLIPKEASVTCLQESGLLVLPDIHGRIIWYTANWFKKFQFSPRLPAASPMRIRHIHAFDNDFEITVNG